MEEAEILPCKGNDQFVYSMLLETEVSCAFAGCVWSGQMDAFLAHSVSCDYGTRPCRYAEVGCEFKGEKAELLQHENSAKDLHLKLLEQRLSHEMRRNEELGEELGQQKRTSKALVDTLTLELRAARQQVETLQRHSEHAEKTVPSSVPAAESFRWDAALQNGQVFQFTNDGKTVKKLNDTTYSVITRMPLADKAVWCISLDKVQYYHEPALGFGICTRDSIGACTGTGGYLSCDGAIGVTVRNGLKRMKGKVDLVEGDTYFCEFNMKKKIFLIIGNKKTYAIADILPGKYYIYAEFYKSEEQITIK
eukprot:TRINITY_DN4893_c0_g1_i5.p2 TRINITY_DN4893_c0_g1~~TRINITY_DN4893_c0_g1_i5.p2  ORF type:complete len:307 (+),score=103.98 TRINITY_DN4893_c0_g1_i5:221-1141(+)